jgi:type I restriction enzyme S subunit
VSELPKGWTATQLDAIADVLDFEREPINSSEREARVSGKAKTDLFPYFGATGQVGFIDSYRSEGQRVLLGEDAAPFLDPAKDKAYLVNGRFWVNNHAHVLAGAAGLIDNQFLCHQLNTVDYHPFVTGSTRLKLTSSAMKQIPVVVAPVAEQTRIVEKLEELLTGLDVGVAELKAAQKKLAQYRQSLLKAAVEGALTAEWRAANKPTETGAQLLERILQERRARWEAKQLAKFKEQGKAPPKDWQKKYPEPVQPDTTDLPELPQGWVWASVDQLTNEKKYGSSSKTNEDASGVPILRMGNIQDGDLDFSSLKYLPAAHDEFPNLHLQDGDLLFNRTNSPELVGKTAVFRSQISPCSFASYLISVRFSEHYIPELASTFINSAHGKRWIKSVVVQQVGQANVNGSKLSALAVPLPPFDEQVEVIARLNEQLDQIVQQLKSVEISLKQSKAQRQNILKAAFSGQLVPQDPSDEPASELLERIRADRAAQQAVKKPRGRKAKVAA